MSRTYLATKAPVANRGVPPDSFLDELIGWAKSAPESLFAVNDNPRDFYAFLRPALGPYASILHRRACACEGLRVLAGEESSWNWSEGADASAGKEAPDETETGIFQVSPNSMRFDVELSAIVDQYAGGHDIQTFIASMKTNHTLALEYCMALLRKSVEWDGPILRGDVARNVSRESVAEFEQYLS